MAKKPKTPSKQDVEAYKHGKAKRKMIPTAEQQGFVEEEEARPKRLRYPRNPDLDPQLIWAGGRFQVPREQLEAALANGGFLDLEAARLVWKGKDEEDATDLFADAPPIYIQEKISSRQIIERLKRDSAQRRESTSAIPDLFADFNGRPHDLEARTEFYAHDQNWSNRMILGDSLLVMACLAERENLRGKVQCIFFDPPYGISFNSNWQAKTSSRKVDDGKQESITREPEVIKAFRDTWKDGIHSYTSYIRDRLIVAKELLHESGSIFVQIGDQNVHLIRSLLDEVFGPACFVVQIAVKKKGSQISHTLDPVNDYIVWYGRNEKESGRIKSRPLFTVKEDEQLFDEFDFVELEDGKRVSLSKIEEDTGIEYSTDYKRFQEDFPGAKLFGLNPLKSGGFRKNQSLDFNFQNRIFPIGERAPEICTVA